MRGQMSFFNQSETATMRDRTRSRKYSPMVEEFRRVHKEQRDWGLERRHEAKLRRIYGDNVPVTKEEWIQARAARLAPVAEPPEPVAELPEPVVEVSEQVDEPVAAPDVENVRDVQPDAVVVAEPRRIVRLERHRDVSSADGNYRSNFGYDRWLFARSVAGVRGLPAGASWSALGGGGAGAPAATRTEFGSLLVPFERLWCGGIFSCE
ncbi:hypothetical protein [Dactylosporangium sp. NPDC051541]|uniref:hypothetical protein n=1 Tax=Dactylosporangium sp. NPDC051541 TaxID=3363977 RepID=UPI0037A77BE5